MATLWAWIETRWIILYEGSFADCETLRTRCPYWSVIR